MPSKPRSAKLVIAWAARFSPRSQPSPGRTLSWPGTASWSLANSMARRFVMARVDRGSSARWSNGSFAWRARTGTGAITGLRALANLGYIISDQTVGNVLQRHALPPAPEHKRTTTWPVFIRTHLALLAGTDFFTAEVLTLRGLVTYYALFFIHLESRRGYRRHHHSPGRTVDEANRPQRNCGMWCACRASSPRSRRA